MSCGVDMLCSACACIIHHDVTYMLAVLQEGKGFDDGKMYSMAEYRQMADQSKQKW